MKNFLVKYQYLLPLTAGILLAGIGVYYFWVYPMDYGFWPVLLAGSLMNFYFANKLKPPKEQQ